MPTTTKRNTIGCFTSDKGFSVVARSIPNEWRTAYLLASLEGAEVWAIATRSIHLGWKPGN